MIDAVFVVNDGIETNLQTKKKKKDTTRKGFNIHTTSTTLDKTIDQQSLAVTQTWKATMSAKTDCMIHPYNIIMLCSPPPPPPPINISSFLRFDDVSDHISHLSLRSCVVVFHINV